MWLPDSLHPCLPTDLICIHCNHCLPKTFWIQPKGSSSLNSSAREYHNTAAMQDVCLAEHSGFPWHQAGVTHLSGCTNYETWWLGSERVVCLKSRETNNYLFLLEA